MAIIPAIGAPTHKQPNAIQNASLILLSGEMISGRTLARFSVAEPGWRRANFNNSNETQRHIPTCIRARKMALEILKFDLTSWKIATSMVVDFGPPPKINTMVKLVKQRRKTRITRPGKPSLSLGSSIYRNIDREFMPVMLAIRQYSPGIDSHIGSNKRTIRGILKKVCAINIPVSP